KNVTGIGLGKKYINSQNTDEFCINVFVEKKEDLNTLKKSDIIPSKYMGIKTDVIEIGKVTGDSLNTKIRPVQCGYSIGPANVNTVGTAGCIVQRGFGNNISYFILCNNHILTNNQTLPIGTRIIQPARLDGGTIFDQVATLSNYTPLFPGGSQYNSVDCAIARISNNSLISNEIAWQGYPKGVGTARVGELVKKVGRSSGRTLSTVRSIGTTLYVDLGFQTYLFYDQITINKFTNNGDSGSLVLNSFNEAIGLHMASSGQMSIANNINNVLRSLNVELTT
ncbi:MAG: serine protease, partial [Sarcina sp.]